MLLAAVKCRTARQKLACWRDMMMGRMENHRRPPHHRLPNIDEDMRIMKYIEDLSRTVEDDFSTVMHAK